MDARLFQAVSYSVPPRYKSTNGRLFRRMRPQQQVFEHVAERIGEPMIANVSANQVSCGKALDKRLSGYRVIVPNYTSYILHILYLLLRNLASSIFGVYCHTRVDEFKTCTTVVIA